MTGKAQGHGSCAGILELDCDSHKLGGCLLGNNTGKPSVILNHWLTTMGSGKSVYVLVLKQGASCKRHAHLREDGP